MRLKDSGHHLTVLAAYGLLFIVLTWPLVANMQTHVLGAGTTPGDNFEYVWKMWWVPHAIFDQGISPFFNPNIAYPDGYPLAYGEITPTHTFLLAPITLLTGPVFAYNLAILLSAALTGWLMYLLARRKLLVVAGAPALIAMGAFLAGVLLTFSSYRFIRSAGHLPLIDTQWLVLALLGLDQWLEIGTWRAAIILGLGIALAALSSWYYGFMLVLLLPVYVLAYKGKKIFAVLKNRRTWLTGGLTLAVIGVLTVAFLLPYLQVSATGAAAIPLEDARFWAASPLDYVLPNALHPLWGTLVQGIAWPFPGVDMPYEFMLSLGWLTLLLGVVGWWRTTGFEWRGYKWMLVAAFILSLGPFLTLGRLPTPLPLPVLVLREILPFADGVRSWGRFSIFVTLSLSLLAGYGFISLVRRYGVMWQYGLFFLVMGGFLFGMWRPPLLMAVEPRPVDLWLADQPNIAPIMQFPVDEALSGPAMLYTRYHGKPVVYGYGTYYPFLFREQYPMLADFPADPALDQLVIWGVHFVVVNLTGYEPDTLVDQSRLEHVVTLENQAVYMLIP